MTAFITCWLSDDPTRLSLTAVVIMQSSSQWPAFGQQHEKHARQRAGKDAGEQTAPTGIGWHTTAVRDAFPAWDWRATPTVDVGRGGRYALCLAVVPGLAWPWIRATVMRAWGPVAPV